MARHISKETVSQVESQTDIVSLVGEYVALEERGRDYWGCCPFHKEDTPSFHVDPGTGFYYCFGCHAAGKAVKFVQEMEKISFPEAILFLAKRAGIEVVYDNNYENAKDIAQEEALEKEKEAYIDLYERVSKSFHHLLVKNKLGSDALIYIKRRGLTNDTIEKFQLGFAPRDMRWLRKFLEGKSFSADFLDKSGLFSRKNKEIAFFSNRLIFPIFDRFSRVVAFGGRDLSNGEAAKTGFTPPKYLNSGDLVQYKKGETLYAFNFAKDAIRANKKVVFCEGYMDCIAYHQCGVEYAVAPLGTALTVEQIKMVKPFIKEVLLGFDNDSAGLKATKRAILMLREEDIPSRVVVITGGKDPAEIMVKEGNDAPNVLTKIVENAIIDSKFLLGALGKEFDKGSPQGKREIAENYFPYIRALKSSIERDATLKDLADDIGVEIATIKKDFDKSAQKKTYRASYFSIDEASEDSKEALYTGGEESDSYGDVATNDWDESNQWDDTEAEAGGALFFDEGEGESDYINEGEKSGHYETVEERLKLNEDIIGRFSSEVKSVIVFINALVGSADPKKFSYIFDTISEKDFKEEKAKGLFSVLKKCFDEGRLSALDFRGACTNKDLADAIMTVLHREEYSVDLGDEVDRALRLTERASLIRKRDDLQDRINTIHYLDPSDRGRWEKLVKDKEEMSLKINNLSNSLNSSLGK